MVAKSAMPSDSTRSASGHESASGMVDDEARRVLAAHRRVAEAPGERAERIARPRLGQNAIHHFDHLHHRHRVEEVITGDAAGMLARRRHRGDRERGGVGRQDAVAVDGFLETGKELPLGVEVLDDGFDDDVARCEAFQRIGDFYALQGLFHLRAAEPALFHQLAQGLRDRLLRLARGAGLGVEQQGARAALRQDLCDAPAHGAGTGDAGDEVAALGI